MGSHKRWKQRGNSGNFVKWETPGQALEGRVTGIRDGKFGDICDLETDDIDDTGKRVRVTFPVQTALALLFESADIKVGDEIRVVFVGYRKNEKSGRDFKDFELYTAEGDEEVDVKVEQPGNGPDEIPF